MWSNQGGWQGQGWGRPAASGFTPTSSQSSAFLARATNITLTADKTNYDTLITGLVNDSVFSKLDFLYIFAAPDSTTAKLNLISGSSYNPATYNGTPSEASQFSAYHGYTGDGSTVFVDSVTAPGSGNFLQDSASFGCYITVRNGAGSDLSVIGAKTAGGVFADFSDLSHVSSTTILYRVNDSGGSFQTPTVASNNGMYVLTRTGASAYASYRNGSSLDTGTNSSVSISGLPSFYILARNDSGTGATTFSFDQVSAAFVGGGLSSTDAGNLSTRLNTFMTAYGVNAY